jgi:hypothetical protein
VRIVPETTELAIVTSPQSDRLATCVFHDGDLEIRIVSFSPNRTNFTATGPVDGTLVRQRNLPSGATLWAMNVSVGKGHHTISFTPDLNKEVKVTVEVRRSISLSL